MSDGQRRADRLRAGDRRTRPAGRSRPTCASACSTALQRLRRGQRRARLARCRRADLPLRKLAALEALARDGRRRRRRCSTASRIEPNLWPTSAVIDWWSDPAARCPTLPERDARLARGRADPARAPRTSRARRWASPPRRSDALWWLMVSRRRQRRRAAAARCSTSELWRDDMPRLVRGALGAAAARRLGHDGRQRLGRAGAGASSPRAFESDAGHRRDRRRRSAAQRDAGRLERRRRRAARSSLPWPAAPADARRRARRHRRPWVTVQSARRDPARRSRCRAATASRSTVDAGRAADAGQAGSAATSCACGSRSRRRRDMTWVVVDDPVPAGASHPRHRPRRATRRSPTARRAATRLRLARVRRAHASTRFRAYYELRAEGHASSSSTRCASTRAGRFELPPTRVEAMYAPEMFGEMPNAPVEVQP